MKWTLLHHFTNPQKSWIRIESLILSIIMNDFPKKQGFDSAVRRVLLDLQWFDTSFRADDVMDHGPWTMDDLILGGSISKAYHIYWWRYNYLSWCFCCHQIWKTVAHQIGSLLRSGNTSSFPSKKTQGKNPNNLVKGRYHIISYHIISYHIYLYTFHSTRHEWYP